MEKFAVPVTASEHVFTILKQWILSGELTPGEKIDQDAVANRLGLSKMPVRSALEKLAAHDLVDMHSHRGVIVRKLSEEHLNDIYIVRCELEELAVKLATRRLAPQDIKILEGMIKEQEMLYLLHSSENERILEANREFHMYIYKLADNPVLLTVIERLWIQSERYRRILLDQPGMIEGSTQDHRHLVELMSKQLEEEAGRFIMEHNRKTQQVVLNILRSQHSS
ncbi:GntR family transcriptional regulator [Paenibacillus mendelii]|uniref:GntR family transcriptional regulator n=1 Tax=Paenibacillus mendelii TaxID=206163 RepID=A0ABV6JAZ2_9BACL|nr:GntR family transcriptional regulator [Paenibacillus mendelii]MCQ6562961.1 GntR family transcriptional regulator [Paenibacillus mendelii]